LIVLSFSWPDRQLFKERWAANYVQWDEERIDPKTDWESP